MQQRFELVCRHWRAEQITHEMLAAMLGQQCSLLQRFHTRGDEQNLGTLGQSDGRLCCSIAGIVGPQALHQSLGELDLKERKSGQNVLIASSVAEVVQ